MMKAQLSFFEIPAQDFDRAVKFYSEAFGFSADVCECGSEKMGMLDAAPVPGAIFFADGFAPGKNGVIITFEVEDIEKTLEKVIKEGGTIEKGKTKIEADNMGWFALLLDSEGNRIGLHSS